MVGRLGVVHILPRKELHGRAWVRMGGGVGVFLGFKD